MNQIFSQQSELLALASQDEILGQEFSPQPQPSDLPATVR